MILIKASEFRNFLSFSPSSSLAPLRRVYRSSPTIPDIFTKFVGEFAAAVQVICRLWTTCCTQTRNTAIAARYLGPSPSNLSPVFDEFESITIWNFDNVCVHPLGVRDPYLVLRINGARRLGDNCWKHRIPTVEWSWSISQMRLASKHVAKSL